MNKKKRANHYVLLQVISDQLIWMEVKQTEGHTTITGGGVEPILQPDADDDSASPSTQHIKESIKAVIGKLQLSWFAKPEIILIVPNHRLTARFMETPPAADDEISGLVSFEVSETLQVPVDDIAWDMLISSAHGIDMQKHVLWVAARKDFIHSLVREWADNNLPPSQITPDFWAIYEFLISLDEASLNDPTVIISQEGDRATITVANRRAIYVNRSVTLSRPTLKESFEDTELQKERILATEIERTMSFSSDRFPRGTIRNMILCGFAEWELNNIQQVAERNQLTVNHLLPQDILSFFHHSSGDISTLHLPHLCIAFCRLQQNITGINLLDKAEDAFSWQTALHEAAAPSKLMLTLAVSLVILLLGIWGGGQYWYQSKVETILDKGEDMIELASRLHHEEMVLREMVRKNIKYGDIILFLSEVLPKGVMVNSLTIDTETGLELALMGVNHQRLIQLELIDKLNESPHFKEVVLDRSVMESGQFLIYLKGKCVASS